MSLKKELAELQEKLAALEERIKADDAEAIEEGAKLMADIEAKEAEIEKAEKKAAILGKIGKKAKDEEEPSFLEKLNAKSLAKKTGSVSAYLKAYNDNHTDPKIEEFDRDVATPDELPGVSDLFAQGTTAGNSVAYVVLGAREGDPAVTAEGAKKPQIHYPITRVSKSLVKIAAFMKDTDELLEDDPRLVSAINDCARMDLVANREAYLVGDLLDTSGVQQGESTITFDNILKAAMDIMAATGYVADGVVFNPANWYSLRTAKDENGQYILGGPAFAAYANGAYQETLRLWDTLRVRATPAMPAGECVVGAFRRGGKVYSKAGEGVRVEVSNSNEDDFLYNLITIRVEERKLLAVKKPDAFVIVGTEESGS